MKAASLVLALLLLLPLPATAGCSVFERGEQSSPQRLAEAYLNAFRDRQFDQMIILSGGWTGSQEELDYFRRLVEMIDLKSYTIEQVKMIGKSEALVRVTVNFSLLGREKTQTDLIRAYKEEGKWYLAEGVLD